MPMRRQVRSLLRPILRRVPVLGARWDPVWRRRWLLDKMPKESTCAEVGVWKGDFSAAILDVVRPVRLYLVDPWKPADGPDRVWMSEVSALDQTFMDSLHESVLGRFRAQIGDGTVVVHRATALDAARHIPDDSLDWVYIDGDHSYEGARADLMTYSPKVRPGGYVCGDDYSARRQHRDGVKRAVDEVAATGALNLLEVRARQFIFQRPTV